MRMENWWNDIDRGKEKTNLSQCHFSRYPAWTGLGLNLSLITDPIFLFGLVSLGFALLL